MILFGKEMANAAPGVENLYGTAASGSADAIYLFVPQSATRLAVGLAGLRSRAHLAASTI